jgi:uncharacterized peroxidase-related enzyme
MGRKAGGGGHTIMSFLRTIGDQEASGEVADVYDQERKERGYVMDATRALSTRPEVLLAWERFMAAACKGGFTLSLRDWRLITLVAAKHIGSTYCSLVYGRALVEDLGSAEAVLAVERDFRSAGLSERKVAMLEYAEKVTVAAHAITEDDVERLRQHGFSDEQVFDVALCAAIRNMFSRLIDAVGATPDPDLRELEPAELRDALTVGRQLG